MYASDQDIDRLYPGKLDLVALLEDGETRDTARIDDALADATATINSYVSRRYPLPLSAVPMVLKSTCVDIALWRLASTADVLTEEISKRHELALGFLKDLAAGRAALDLPGSAPEALAPDLPMIETTGKRHFRRSENGGL